MENTKSPYGSYGIPEIDNSIYSGLGAYSQNNNTGVSFPGDNKVANTSYPLGPTNNNMNYPEYNMGPSSIGPISQGVNMAGDVAMSTGNPVGVGAGLIFKTAGLGLDIYDKQQQRDQAKDNYEKMLQEYKRREEIETMDRAQEKRRLERQEGYFGADYAMDLGDRLSNQYTGQRVGGQR